MTPLRALRVSVVPILRFLLSCIPGLAALALFTLAFLLAMAACPLATAAEHIEGDN
jgi:flagellar biosynthesis component FlhA